jgi:cysteinyl-tRNA synthetase
MLQVEGKKMSKSLGNFFTVRDLLDQGVPGEVIRYVFLMTHYRSPMDWTAEKAHQAKVELHQWAQATAEEPDVPVSDALIEALADDLNTHQALTEMRRMHREGRLAELRASMKFLGFGVILSAQAVSISTSVAIASAALAQELPADTLSIMLMRFADLRSAAMASKDFSALDALKSALIAAGVEVRMSKAGVELVPGPDFDPTKLEALQ